MLIKTTWIVALTSEERSYSLSRMKTGERKVCLSARKTGCNLFNWRLQRWKCDREEQKGWFYLSRYFCADVSLTQMTLPLFDFGCPHVSSDTCAHLSFTFLPINTSSIPPHHYFPPSPSSVSLHPPLDFPVCDHSPGIYWCSPHSFLCPSDVLSLIESPFNESSDRSSHTPISLLSISVWCVCACTCHEPDDHKADHSLSSLPALVLLLGSNASSLSVSEFSCSSGVFQSMKCVCACVCVFIKRR